MSNYVRGRAYEYEVVKLFKDAGYKVVRTAGSHGEFDLIARKQTATHTYESWIAVYVQCKTHKRRKRGKA